MFLGDGGIEDRVFLVGESIEFTAYTFEGIDDL